MFVRMGYKNFIILYFNLLSCLSANCFSIEFDCNFISFFFWFFILILNFVLEIFSFSEWIHFLIFWFQTFKFFLWIDFFFELFHLFCCFLCLDFWIIHKFINVRFRVFNTLFKITHGLFDTINCYKLLLGFGFLDNFLIFNLFLLMLNCGFLSWLISSTGATSHFLFSQVNYNMNLYKQFKMYF